jgi:hypothetical protein
MSVGGHSNPRYSGEPVVERAQLLRITQRLAGDANDRRSIRPREQTRAEVPEVHEGPKARPAQNADVWPVTTRSLNDEVHEAAGDAQWRGTDAVELAAQERTVGIGAIAIREVVALLPVRPVIVRDIAPDSEGGPSQGSEAKLRELQPRLLFVAALRAFPQVKGMELMGVEAIPQARSRGDAFLDRLAGCVSELPVDIAGVDLSCLEEHVERARKPPISSDWHKQTSDPVPKGRAALHHFLKDIDITLRDSERPLGPADEVGQTMMAVEVGVKHCWRKHRRQWGCHA